MKPPKDFSNLFLDMNAFFAAVEQQVQPKLRDQPICVAPYTGSTGCCIAKSYAAKPFGVKTGTLVGEARKLCPQIHIIESHPELYMYYHRQIVKVLESFSPFVQVLSIDEFNIKLTGSDQSRKKSLQMAEGLKKAIREKIGDYLTCSVGISANQWLAKVAGELKKPDGLVILTLEELPALYRSLNLTDLPGINIGMERQLHRKKIKTPFDFYGQPLFNLSRWFGHPGRIWFYRLRGYEIETVTGKTKSIGHQHVLAPAYRSRAAARKVVVKLAEKCAARLRTKNFYAGGVSVSIKFIDGPARQLPDGSRRLAGGPFWGKHISTDLMADSKNIIRAVLRLYDECHFAGSPLRVSVTLFNLQQIQGHQISLFADLEKSLQLSRAMDEINDKFGPDTIISASMFDTTDAAPTRIPFGDPERLKF